MKLVPRGALAPAVGLMAACLAVAWPAAAPAQEVSAKALRQIGVMEKILDKVLLDSPNFLVHGSNNAHGLVIEPVGAIFTFDVSLVNQWFNLKDYLVNAPDYEIQENEDGDQVIVLKSKKKDKDKDEDAENEDEKAKKPLSAEILLEQGKAELVQTLLDYGETLTSLKNGQWIIIAAFVETEDFIPGQGVTRLIVKTKIDDLRSYSAGDITESVARSRVDVEMY
jgi:hypothetical protein